MLDRLKDVGRKIIPAATAGFVGFGAVAGDAQADASKMLTSPGNQIQRGVRSAQPEGFSVVLPRSQAPVLRGSYSDLYQQPVEEGDQPPPSADLGANIGLPDPNLSARVELPQEEIRANIEIKEYDTKFLPEYPGRDPGVIERTKKKLNELFSIASVLHPTKLAPLVNDFQNLNREQPRFLGLFGDWEVYHYTLAVSKDHNLAPKGGQYMYEGESIGDKDGKTLKQLQLKDVILEDCNPNTIEAYLELYMLQVSYNIHSKLLVPKMMRKMSFVDMDTYLSSEEFKRDLDADVSLEGVKFLHELMKEPYASNVRELGLSMTDRTKRILSETRGMSDQQIRQYIRELSF